MSNTEETAATEIQERLVSLGSLVNEIEAERLKGEETLDTISKTHEKINEEGHLNAEDKQTLKGLYLNALKDASQKEDLARQALAKINEIRTIRNEQEKRTGVKESFHRSELMRNLQISAQTIPLWVGKQGTQTPALCGAVPAKPSYIAKPGDMVAAHVKIAEDGPQWILAEVVKFNANTKKYEVDDIDDIPDRRHILGKRKVVPLPLMRANPATDSHALFREGDIIMALYPQTTCFYTGIISKLPATMSDGYKVIFEDKTHPEGYLPPIDVPQRYVINLKGKKIIKS